MEHSHHRAKQLRARLLVVLAVLSLLSLANLFLRLESLPAEVSLRLECGKLITQGKIPYVDFFVLDSPVSLFIASIPAEIASLLNCNSGHMYASATLVFEWIVSIASLALTSALLLRRSWLRDSLWCQCILLTVAFLNISCVFQFGQTEHFLMLGLVPYIISRWLEYGGKKLTSWELILSGLFGGIAITLDPFFLVLPIAIDGALSLHFKRFPIRLKSTFNVLAGTTALILFSLYGLGGAMMESYHSNILPMLIADRESFDNRLYGFKSAPDSRLFTYLLVLSTLLALGVKKRSSILAPLIISGWLGFIYLVAEGKGYFHQALPMYWCASLSISIVGATILIDVKRQLPSALVRFARLPAITIFVLSCTICSALLIEQEQQTLADTATSRHLFREIVDVFDTFNSRSKQSDKVLVLNCNVTPMYPAITLQDKIPGSRIMWGFHIPILMRMKAVDSKTPPKVRERLERFYNGILLDDLKCNPPTLVLTDQGNTGEYLQGSDVQKMLKEHYTQEGETQFHSDNFPPREFTNQNYPLWVHVFTL